MSEEKLAGAIEGAETPKVPGFGPLNAADAVKIARHLHEHIVSNKTLKGEKGERGIPGPEGPPAAQGERGPEGPVGPQGPRGEKGDTGDQGARGPAGPIGPEGPEGRQGPKGEKGEPGQRGLEGPTGPQGPQGARGADGKTGSQGPKGDKGEDGVAGANYSCRARATRELFVAASPEGSPVWVRVQFDTNDYVSGGYHSAVTDNDTFQVAFEGIHSVTAAVPGVNTRIVVENDVEANVIAEGFGACATEFKFRKFDRVRVEVSATKDIAVKPRSKASPVFVIRKVDKSG